MRPPPRGLALLALALALACARAGRAAEEEPAAGAGAEPAPLPPSRRPLLDLPLDELGRLEVVTAGRRPERLEAAPAAVHVITAEDIRRAGVTTLAEALRLAPGVHVARIHSGQWAIGVRGFTDRLSRSLLVLVDGRSVYSPLFAGVYWEVQDLLLEDVDRIEVIRGPGGALWGANAVNGIVNVITRAAADTAGGHARVRLGPQERPSLGLRYGARLGPEVTLRVWEKYFHRDVTRHPDGRDFDDWRMGRAGFRADWESPRSGATARLDGVLYAGRAGQRARVTAYDPPSAPLVEGDARLSGGHLLAGWERPLERGAIALQAWYDRTRRREPLFEETRDTFDVDLAHRHAAGSRHDLAWGAAWRVTRARTSGPETVRFVPPQRTDHLLSAFLSDDVALVRERLRLSLGARLEHNEFTGVEAQPSLGLVWQATPRQNVWAAAARSVRTPTATDRDLEFTALVDPRGPTFTRVLGSPRFESEKVVTAELGWRVRPEPRLSLDLVGFWTRYRDLLSLEPLPPFVEPGTGGPRTIHPLVEGNGLRGEAHGAEVAAVAAPLPGWRLWGHYAWLELDLRRSPGSGDRTQVAAEGRVPRHQALLRTAVDLPGDLELDLRLRRVGRLRALDVPGYTELGARFAAHPRPWLELAVVGENLLHRSHVEFGAAQPPRPEIERSAFAEALVRW